MRYAITALLAFWLGVVIGAVAEQGETAPVNLAGFITILFVLLLAIIQIAEAW